MNWSTRAGIPTLPGSTTTVGARFKFRDRSALFDGRTARRLMAVHALRVCGLRVLREVDTGRLVVGADPEAHETVDQLGQHVRHDEGIYADDNCGQRLLAELRESAAIEEALGATRHHLGGQESDQQHAADA